MLRNRLGADLMAEMLRASPPEENWSDDAACKGKPVDWWFPNERNVYLTVKARYPEALPICEACPVRTACAVDAVNFEFGRPHDGGAKPIGMFGGLAPLERATLHQIRNRHQREGVA